MRPIRDCVTGPAESGLTPGALGAQGQALILVLAILLVVTASSASFIWFMNQQQTRAGQRYRALAALRAAEAGVHRALGILESEAPDGTPGREWRPVAYGEPLNDGALTGGYTVRVADEVGGVLVITSEGRSGDVVRRVRARAVLASPALLSALFVSSTAQFERPPAATFLIPYGAGIGDRPWFHIAAGQEIWFADLRVSLNDPMLPYEKAPGPVDVAGGLPPSGAPPELEPLRVLMADGAGLTLGTDRMEIDVTQLRHAGIRLDGDIRRVKRLPPVPEVDRAYYRTLAGANIANAEINRSAGRRAGDADLERKTDSLYDRHQMARILEFLAAEFASEGRARPLGGVVYVQGPVMIPPGVQVRIADGALIAESTLKLESGGELHVTHTALTRTLPGIVVLGHGALVVAPQSRLLAHGLVYANRVFDAAAGARVEIVGALVGNDPQMGYRNDAATVIIRYDPAVLGTPGLSVPGAAPVLAWVVGWEELPP